MTRSIEHSKFEFLTDEDSEGRCQEILSILTEHYELPEDIAVSAMNKYWAGQDLRQNPYFGNRDSKVWASKIRQSQLKDIPRSLDVLVWPGLSLRQSVEFVTRLLGDQAPNSPSFLGGRSPNAAIEARDSGGFNSEWSRVFNRIREAKDCLESEFHRPKMEVAEAVERSTSSWELAACVGDDAELLLLALRVGLDDPWLSALLGHYIDHEFPMTNLRPRPETLGSILSNYARNSREKSPLSEEEST